MLTETTFAATRSFPSKDGAAVIELTTDRTGNLHIVRGRRATDQELLVRRVFSNLDEARAFANRLWETPAPAPAPPGDAVQDARRVQQAVAATPAPTAPRAAVPVGHYAVEYQGALRFYAVVEGKGRWAGRTFVNRYHSDDLLDIHRTEALAVRALIAQDIEAAGQRFAAELTRCRRCARMLTDLPTAKRNGGWGPECVKKVER